MASLPISVLLPVRNGAEHLPEAIASLEAQSLADFEVCAVDDGSTDDTYGILASWASRDQRVRVERTAELGIVPALERARAMSRGRFLARMDADDVCHPERFRRQMALIAADPELVIVGCRVEYFPREILRDGALRYEKWLNAPLTSPDIEREIFVECPLAHPTFFMRAEAVGAVGGYRDEGWAEDYDLILRSWRAGGRLGKVDAPLLRWREGETRLSRRHGRYSPAAFRRCKVHHLRLAFGERLRGGIVVWGAGPVGKALSRELRRVGLPLAAFTEVDPRKIGQAIHGVPVLDASAALSLQGVFHLGAVGQKGVRRRLRGVLLGGGLRELEDFVLMA